jgi:hypothetical protein
MMTKIAFNTVAGTFPEHLLVRSSTIDAEALRRSAAEMDRATDKIAAERYAMNFGKRISQAVRARQQPRIFASASDESNSFGKRLKKAVEKKSGKKEREERLKRERERYHNRPRPHTKSD